MTTARSTTQIDHLVVTAPTLSAGAAWVRTALGAECRPGGRHKAMGTHNALLRLGDDVYLEVIAVDPNAPPPGRPRWFGLDHLAPDAVPRLAGWVARTDDILATASANPEPVGPIETMTRGDQRWRITIPPDGSLPLDGAGPLLIQWDNDAHPAARLPDDGYELIGMSMTHPDPDRLTRLLDAIGFAGPVTVVVGQHVGPEAEIRTSIGIRWIGNLLVRQGR